MHLSVCRVRLSQMDWSVCRKWSDLSICCVCWLCSFVLAMWFDLYCITTFLWDGMFKEQITAVNERS